MNLPEITYKPGWRLRQRRLWPAENTVIWWEFEAPDANNPQFTCTQSGREWLIPEYASDEDIARTAFMAVLACEEHEAREHLKMFGRKLFDPHIRLAQPSAGAMGHPP